MTRSRVLRLSVTALLLVAGVTAAAGVALRGGSTIPKELQGIVLDDPTALASVTLAASRGPVDMPGAVSGRWVLLTLGFTHCPDICPFILENLAAVERHIKGSIAPEIALQVVFLSVDPARDDPEHLAEYVEYFSPGFIGITGETEELDRFVDRLGAFYRLGPKDAGGSYTVTHSAEVYLLDPRGRLFARFVPPIDPDRMASDLQRIWDFYQRSPSAS